MYGIINVAIQDYALANFGQEKWDVIKQDSGVDIDFSLTDNVYSDTVAYKIAQATANEMNLDANVVLQELGENVIYTTSTKFNSFIDSRGDTLKDYLVNLPNFHNRIAMIYPELNAPQFKVSHVEDDSLHMHYVSQTKGISPFIKGYLIGLTKLFNEPQATVTFLESVTNGRQQDIFKISW
ncbi:heme NO-binding protein [Flavobacterium sp. Sd200]|uniref:heme NO-binding domain-containing protein n=1 Tax=Flavobacterium sp. Sd200 TaxID=2692211 RepID=UPI00136CAAA8|nr:heme NO-binding domain-containing protein [Flavobacterium sp. Sd200]MXN92710.1 heme NO-binding protein [Flavobacterium sp. Sd200]